jgi:hypothetical protein
MGMGSFFASLGDGVGSVSLHWCVCLSLVCMVHMGVDGTDWSEVAYIDLFGSHFGCWGVGSLRVCCVCVCVVWVWVVAGVDRCWLFSVWFADYSIASYILIDCNFDSHSSWNRSQGNRGSPIGFTARTTAQQRNRHVRGHINMYREAREHWRVISGEERVTSEKVFVDAGRRHGMAPSTLTALASSGVSSNNAKCDVVSRSEPPAADPRRGTRVEFPF